jgi:serine/threonine-protein kinase
MDKRPAGAKPAAPKKPAAAAPAASAQEADTLVGADHTVDPVGREDAPPPGETEFMEPAADQGADDEAASFLLGEEARAPKAPPADAPEDAGTVLVDDGAPAGPPAAEGPEGGGETAMFAESAKAEGEATAPPPAEAAEPAPKRPAAPPGSKAPPKTTTLAGYRLLKKLGAGGMGTVYLAHQTRLDQQVALKVLSKELASKPAFVQRFLREARVMARLDHPNILRCFDVGEAQGFHYLAMEYADGGSVEGWLKKLGRMSLGDALHVTLACARALQHAHELTMVHRDVKPDNLLLTAKGVVKLADLGLAKAQDDDLSLTKTGTGAGTPLYMAPEQARDVKRVDGRTDIYALGCMLYRFLAGEVPFTGETLVEVIAAKEKGKFPPLRQRNDEVPARLDLIVDKMLAANPAHRYQTCADLVTDLEGLGLASATLSFVAAPAAAKKPAPAPAAKPQPRKEPARASAPPASRPAIPPAAQKKPEADAAEPGVWYVSLQLPGGKKVVKRATHEELVTLLRSESLGADTPVSRTEKGTFRAAATYAELNQVLHARAVKTTADRKAQKYKALYAQIAKEDERRRRWRWLRNLTGRVGGFVGFLIWLGILVGICVGGYFLFRWLIYYVGERLPGS